jgi:hypothetical protein
MHARREKKRSFGKYSDGLNSDITFVILLTVALWLISFNSLAETPSKKTDDILVELSNIDPSNTKNVQTDVTKKPISVIGLAKKDLIGKNTANKDIGRKDKIYQSAVDFAQWIDNFFGEAEELESASYDFLRLVNTVGWREGEGVKYRPRINAKVNLPRMDKSLSLMFADSDDITNSEFESLQTNELFNQDEQKPSAAINYESDYYNSSKIDTRIGIDSSLDLFALIKHTFNIYSDKNLTFKNYNYLFWKEEEHFGFNPKIELNYVINQQNLFRWKYSILLSEKSEGNEWRNTLSLIHQYSKESWLSYDFDVAGASAHEYDVDTYRLAIRYRRQLDVKWLYFEVEPEILWHREPEYIERKLIPGLIFRLEIQFEN